MERNQELFGMPDGLNHGFDLDGSGKILALQGQSDAAFHTGVALAAECLRLQWAVKEQNETQEKEALEKVKAFLKALHRMQKIHGPGLICRNVIRKKHIEPEKWISAERKHAQGRASTYKGLYWFGNLSWDQILSVMFGYAEFHRTIPSLPKIGSWTKLIKQTKEDVLNIEKHFVKHHGFIGDQTNLRAHPWYLAWKWKEVMRIFKSEWNPAPHGSGLGRNLMNFFNNKVVLVVNWVLFKAILGWFFDIKDKNAIYGISILSTCSLFNASKDTTDRLKSLDHKHRKLLIRRGSHQDATNSPIARWAMRLMYRLKNKTWKVPKDVLISGKHLKSGVGTNLMFLAVYPILQRLRSGLNEDDPFLASAFLPIFKNTHEAIEEEVNPFWGYLYIHVTGGSSLKKFTAKNYKEELERSFLNYRGPKMELLTPTFEKFEKIKVLGYAGKVKVKASNPVPMAKRTYHGFWPQSDPYGLIKEPLHANEYDDSAGWLYCFWFRKLRLKS